MSTICRNALVGFAVGFATPANAHEYLTSVTSQIYQAQGTKKEIAQRANICIAQHLAGGTVDAQLIISQDLDNGIIVARNATTHGSFPVFKIRSRFTFEAREGRFRIDQTALERFNDTAGGGWGPIGKWWGSQWKSAEAAFTNSATAVAICVMKGPTKTDDW
ncbi:hypothetical protein LZ016_05130 [Sphingomonas sp. SM33]|uniref:Uncharacterized protein n=1 Tax=Sphingomonas telluris TaxID=2907998 RepID=A0ABS9VL92_9SPHN|nr:hypothetical protein [Sphingomonas telluris]MCH8615483.1 hypothetical protein [Sphingomonas telluris]